MKGCEARVRAHGIDRPCGQRVGVRTWTDEAGIEHAACAVHIAERQHRNPPAIPEPDWVHESKAYKDWLESELREAFGR